MKNQINFDIFNQKAEIKSSRIEKNRDGHFVSEPVLYFPKSKEVVPLEDMWVVLNANKESNPSYRSFTHKGGGYYQFNNVLTARKYKDGSLTIVNHGIAERNVKGLVDIIQKHLNITPETLQPKQDVAAVTQQVMPETIDINDAPLRGASLALNQAFRSEDTKYDVLSFPFYNTVEQPIGVKVNDILKAFAIRDGELMELNLYIRKDNIWRFYTNYGFCKKYNEEGESMVGCQPILPSLDEITAFIKYHTNVVKNQPLPTPEVKIPTQMNVNNDYLKGAHIKEVEMDGKKQQLFNFPSLTGDEKQPTGVLVKDALELLKMGIGNYRIKAYTLRKTGWENYQNYDLELWSDGYGAIGCQKFRETIETIIKFLEHNLPKSGQSTPVVEVKPKQTHININGRALRNASIVEENIKGTTQKILIFPYLYDGTESGRQCGIIVSDVLDILKKEPGTVREVAVYCKLRGNWEYYEKYDFYLRTGTRSEIGCQPIHPIIDEIIKFLEQ